MFEYEGLSEDDIKILDFSLLIKDVLDGIYSLSDLKNFDSENLIVHLIGYSNYHYAHFKKKLEDEFKNHKNPSSIIFKDGSFSDLSIMEAFEGQLGSISNAIIGAVKVNIKSENIASEDDVFKEINCSSLYSIFLNYWLSVIYCGYDVIEKENGFGIQQPDYDLESCLKSNNLRFQKNIVNTPPKIPREIKKRIFLNGDRLKVVSASNNPIKDNELFWSSFSYVSKIYSKRKLDLKSEKYGISIRDCIYVLFYLNCITLQKEKKFELKSSDFDFGKCSDFIFSLSEEVLVRAIANALDKSEGHINKIIDFLCLNIHSDTYLDYWSHPLINIKGNIYFNIGILHAPNIKRLIDNYSKELYIDVSDKGFNYEELCINVVSSSLEENSIIDRFDYPSGLKVKIDGVEEEIDLIFRIGKKIFVCECKSVVFSDSPQSENLAIKSLTKGSEQAKRKAEFVSSNLREIFDKLRWELEEIEYDCIPLVLNETKNISCYKIDGVLISDEQILKNVMSSNLCPIISSLEGRTVTHNVAIKMYSNQGELEEKVEFLLERSAHVSREKYFFRYEDVYVGRKDSVFLRRLVSNDLSLDEYIAANNRKFNGGVLTDGTELKYDFLF